MPITNKYLQTTNQLLTKCHHNQSSPTSTSLTPIRTHHYANNQQIPPINHSPNVIKTNHLLQALLWHQSEHTMMPITNKYLQTTNQLLTKCHHNQSSPTSTSLTPIRTHHDANNQQIHPNNQSTTHHMSSKPIISYKHFFDTNQNTPWCQ